jgi:hypothetical protein
VTPEDADAVGRADQSLTDPDESGAKSTLGSAQDPSADRRAAQDPGAAARADQGVTNPDESGAEMRLGSAPHQERAGGVVDWLLVAFVTLLTGWTALVGIAYLPWYIGPVPMPVSALLGVGAMILAPPACYRLTGSFVAAVLPVASWFVVSVWLVLLRNPMMRGPAVSVVQAQWRVMVLLGLGSLAAAAVLTLLWAERARVRYADADGDSAGGSAV